MGCPSILAGVAPDAPIAVNEDGGKQSASPYRCDLLPPLALLSVAGVLKHGADKYGPHNWRKIPVADHINHAMAHLYAGLAGDKQDSHLPHAACRILFALELAEFEHALALDRLADDGGPLAKAELVHELNGVHA